VNSLHTTKCQERAVEKMSLPAAAENSTERCRRDVSGSFEAWGQIAATGQLGAWLTVVNRVRRTISDNDAM